MVKKEEKTKEETKQNDSSEKKSTTTNASTTFEKPKTQSRETGRGGRGGRFGGGRRTESEFEEKVIQINRITRVVKGGRRLRFRATVVVGDRKGKVGVGVAKGTEVVLAIHKAISKAKKELTSINLNGTTIPHEITVNFGGAKVFLKPASKGTGIVAGGAVRPVLEVCGIKDILSKIMGSNNKVNNTYAVFSALKQLRNFNDSEGAKEK